MTRRTRTNRYPVVPCDRCGQGISTNGLAQSSHRRKHDREDHRAWEAKGLVEGVVVAYVLGPHPRHHRVGIVYQVRDHGVQVWVENTPTSKAWRMVRWDKLRYIVDPTDRDAPWEDDTKQG